ncbi:hypothetical protein J6590_027531 [Homalodisca vitripennis]|nr:hypothetical protein J6590_027531 [Homalodisca vitripennis]
MSRSKTAGAHSGIPVPVVKSYRMCRKAVCSFRFCGGLNSSGSICNETRNSRGHIRISKSKDSDLSGCHLLDTVLPTKRSAGSVGTGIPVPQCLSTLNNDNAAP